MDMNENDEWQELMRGLSAALTKVEDAADRMNGTIRECDRFLERARSGAITQDVLDGLRVGLAFSVGAEWVNDAPRKIVELREQVARHDAKVSGGELPASAHTWRHQIQGRMETLHERLETLARSLADRRTSLEKVAGMR